MAANSGGSPGSEVVTSFQSSLRRSLVNFLKKAAGKCASVSLNLVKLAVFTHCTLEYVGDLVICSGPSMEPNIRSHDILITEHVSPRTGNLNRGDIIVARSPNNPTQFVCKRIVAVHGDHLLQHDGSLQHVPKGHIWIEGDNIENSTDSRTYGAIPIGLVRGRALARIWPFSDLTYLVPPKTKQSIAQS